LVEHNTFNVGVLGSSPSGITEIQEAVSNGGLFFLKKKNVDFVAQLVEHYTFNVGVLGSSPSGITGAASGRFFYALNETID
jgi:hypothetical protein